MFTAVTQLHYQRTSEREHIWTAGEDCLLAGAVLGAEIVRIRFLHGTQFDEARYLLTDGGAGTLPYHSWIITKGDAQWATLVGEAEERTILEPYLQGFALSPTEMRLGRPLASEEYIYGLGEHTGEMNKRGRAFPIWNVDPPMFHGPETENMYTSIPFYLGLHRNSGRTYGVLIDHTGRVEMDMGKTSEEEVQITVQGNSLVAYFFVGPTPADVVRQYTELTGRMPLPPRWILGYHQCRWGYDTEEKVHQLAARLRERNHPCDAIWLDIDYMQGFRNFTWNTETFPNPSKMAEDLHAEGFHLVTIIDPGTKIDDNYFVYQQGMERDYFCRYQKGKIFTGSVWPGACVLPDYSRSEVREWWGNLYKGLLDQGVDAIWNDMNEPALTNILLENETPMHGTTMSDDVLHRAGGDQPTGPDGPPTLHKFFHNAYGMEMARASYKGLLRLHPNNRSFVLSRSGTAGIQRYAALWTGDNTSQWDHIFMAMTMCLNLGMSGVPFVGADIGGFWNASNGELLARFAQLGALLPLCRNHSAIHNPDQEPWAFGEPFESVYRKAIELRYRLMPYLYTLFHEAATSGAPIMRPLYYHYPSDEEACNVQDEFLVGDALLSAPVYEQGATSHRVYLPAGTWFDYWDGTEYPGSGWSDIPAPLDRWPLFVRGNSIIPTGPLMQYTDQRLTDPLTFTCYMATDGQTSYTLYEDDGSTQAYLHGAFALTTINCHVNNDVAIVEIEEQHIAYQPQREEYEIIVQVGGRVLQQRVKAGQGRIVISAWKLI